MSFLRRRNLVSSSGAGTFTVVALLFAVIALAAAGYWLYGRSPAPEPEPETVAPPPVVETETPPKTAKPKVNLPTSGTVAITANVDGANVYLDGESVGTVPFNSDAIDAGNYDVRVTKDGYRDFVSSVRIRAGKNADIRAALDMLPPSLRITSDIPGATVFLDRNYVGTTPVDVDAIDLGEHQMTVSADGYDMHTATVTIAEGRNEVKVDFIQAAAELNERVSVIHKHSFGNCNGTLIADFNGLRYETDHKDAFATTYPLLERFEVDYIKKNMNLKISKGKNFNFTEQSGNADALFVFHKNVEAFLEKN